MINENKRIGSCLCGSIKVFTSFEHVDLGACHCAKCLVWSGGPLMEQECGSDIEFQGEENIRVYNSSKWAERGFCKVCGSHLFIREKVSSSYGVLAGLFKNDAGISFNRQVFFDKKPKYYDFSNETLNISSDYIYKHYPEVKE